MRAIMLAIMAFLATSFVAPAQELSALAKLIPQGSSLQDTGSTVTPGAEITLLITQAVPWRVRLLDAPPRLVLDMREVDWTGIAEVQNTSTAVHRLRAGVFRAGWSRLVLELAGPMLIDEAEMLTNGETSLRLRLSPTTAEVFAAKAALPEQPGWVQAKPANLPATAPKKDGLLMVVLDPGHGGIDPGAERDGHNEAELMLVFAREFKELLLRDGGFDVKLTREDDVFVPLEARISIARAAGADIFISLHADALAEGEATGATIYSLSEEASDAASAALAERHNRDDLLAGVDLTDQDDLVAEVLMDMARTETEPRTARLSQALEVAIKAADLKMHRHPQQQGGFSVLKSPDVPSLLIELGFLSSARDLARLTDPEWRARMTGALRDGLKAWAAEDAVLSGLRKP